MESYEEVLTQNWEKVVRLLAREFRDGFEAGYHGHYMELKPRMSDAYSQGYAAGYDLARMERASEVAGQAV
jgi:hypothetical protein